MFSAVAAIAAAMAKSTPREIFETPNAAEVVEIYDVAAPALRAWARKR